MRHRGGLPATPPLGDADGRRVSGAGFRAEQHWACSCLDPRCGPLVAVGRLVALHSGERRVKQHLNWDGGNLLAGPTVMSRALLCGRRTRAVGPPSLAYDRTLACRRHPHCPLLARSLTGEGRRTPASATTHTRTHTNAHEKTLYYMRRGWMANLVCKQIGPTPPTQKASESGSCRSLSE